MRNSIWFGIAAAMAVVGMGVARAEYWQPVGAKGLGMSGAQVAAPEGSQAVLVNPAALGKKERFDIALPVTLTVGAEGTVVETADKLINNYNTTTKGSVDRLGNKGAASTDVAGDLAKVVNFLAGPDAASLNKPGQGILANVNGALCARWGRFGIEAGTRVFAGGTVRFDNTFGVTSGTAGTTWIKPNSIDANSLVPTPSPSNEATAIASAAKSNSVTGSDLSAAQVQTVIAKVTGGTRSLTAEEQSLLTNLASEVNKSNAKNSAGQNTYTQSSDIKISNQTGIEIRGLMIKEVGVGYGFSFLDDKLKVGPVLKYMQGDTVFSSMSIADEASKDKDIGDELTDDKNSKSTSTFGVDLGVLYQALPRLSVGLVGKDLNGPSFDLARGGSLELDPTVRAGAAFEYLQTPGWRGVLCADVDVLESESAVLVGGKSRDLALGVSQELMGWLSLRAGVNKNLAGESDGLSYSGGLGVQLWHLYLDAAASISSDEVTVDGDDYPSKGGFGVTLGWNMNF